MIDYSYFLERTEGNIEDPKAQAWLSGHRITPKTAHALRLGYYDPGEHGELSDTIGSDQAPKEPVITVPFGKGYFMGIYTGEYQGDRRYYKPKVERPEIWNEEALQESDGYPVIITIDILDALALFEVGIDVIVPGQGVRAQILADRIKARPPEGALVFIPPMDPPIETMAAHGVVTYYSDLIQTSKERGPMAVLRYEGPEALRKVSNELIEAIQDDRQQEREDYLREASSQYMDTFRQALGERTEYKPTPTGIKGLDEIIDGGLYPGLYIMGAVSSLGKTTFILQIADSIAESGRDVIFFTLEQSKDELIAKSLSRLTRSMDMIKSGPLTSRQILYKVNDWIGAPRESSFKMAFDHYRQAIGPHVYYVEDHKKPQHRKNKETGEYEAVLDQDGNQTYTIDRIGLDTIRERVRRHTRVMGKAEPPVIFVDYLQLLRPEDPTGRKSDKQNMDETVSELRRISKAYQVPIFVISSLNRQAYGQPVTMDSFKESGAIEYSSDVLIGLNPSGLQAGETKDVVKNNAKVFDGLRDATKRDMEAVILKNRIGRLGKVPMVFESAYGYYTEGSIEDEEGPFNF